MIVNSIVLDMDARQAFAVVTRRISDWWPAERRHTGDPGSRIHLLASGRFYERASDGREVELGKVTHWSEARLIVLDFYIATGPEHPTEVEISFEESDGRTTVTVVHRPKPESAHLWHERSPRYSASWAIVLGALARRADGLRTIR